MADFKTIREFKKGATLRKISEDPTFLSFFFLFNFSDVHHSPLLAPIDKPGSAGYYLKNFVDKDAGTRHHEHLANFQKILKKINTELPWFWNSISGLELTKQYNKMEDPYWGANKPKLEITCLEENVELTATALIGLYKRAAYDFNRYVEVLPHNLRQFETTIFVTEVRTFQQSITARDTNFYDQQMRGSRASSSFSFKKSSADKSPKGPHANTFDEDLVKQYSLTAKPIISIRLSHCEWDIDSGNEVFADLSKNPEMKKPKLSFFWRHAEEMHAHYGANINQEVEETPLSNAVPKDGLYPDKAFDPLSAIADSAVDFAEGAIDAVTNKVKNIGGSFLNNSEIGNVYGSAPGGPAGTLIDGMVDNVLGALLLGNVHGANTLSNIQDAITAGSVNAIANLAGQLFTQSNSGGEGTQTITPDTVYDATTGGGGVDKISPKKIYDDVAAPNEVPINERVYEPGVDSTPDGNLNQNVHD